MTPQPTTEPSQDPGSEHAWVIGLETVARVGPPARRPASTEDAPDPPAVAIDGRSVCSTSFPGVGPRPTASQAPHTQAGPL